MLLFITHIVYLQVMTNLVRDGAAHCRAQLKKILETAAVEGVSMTTDLWTSCSNTPYIGVTIHFITENMELLNATLCCKELPHPHDYMNISLCIQEVLRTWGLEDKVVAVTTDNCGNMVKTMDLLMEKGVVQHHFRCCGHVLQLAIYKGLQIPSIQGMLTKCRKVVEEFDRSSFATQVLQASQGNQKLALVKECKTRWNSTLHMVQRLIQLRGALDEATQQINKSNQHLASSISSNTPTKEEWEQLRLLVDLLTPFEEATLQLSKSYYPSLPLTPLIVSYLLKFLENTRHLCAPIMQQKLQEWYDDKFFQDKAVLLSQFFDPRFKKMQGARTVDKEAVYEHVQRELRGLGTKKAPSDEAHAGSSQEAKGSKKHWSLAMFLPPDESSVSPEVDELQQYLALPEAVKETSFDVLGWWREHRELLPQLSRLARKYLCMMATSVPSECLFSSAGELLSNKRNRLSSSLVDDILFLRSAMRYVEVILP